MRIVVITSCTGEKAVSPDDQLTIDDFRAGPKHLATREKALKKHMMRADELYTGQQHVRLMRGIRALRESPAGKGKNPKITVDLYILSAGYGLVPADRMLAPYEVTFQGMKVKELRTWADQLNVPEDVSKLLASKYDLALLLLGDSYLKAADLNGSLQPGGTVLAFCGTQGEKALEKTGGARTVVLGNSEAKRFSCGLVGLKGELAKRLLVKIVESNSADLHIADADALLSTLDEATARPATRLDSPKAEKPRFTSHTPRSDARMLYFIPEWDDRVDPDYDFSRDGITDDRDPYEHDVYAHEIYDQPSYDGILVSKSVIEDNKKKRRRIERIGIHRHVRVPRNFPVMGDCGAFNYIDEDEPPYETAETVRYYQALDFDYGVSIDHLIVPAVLERKEWLKVLPDGSEVLMSEGEFAKAKKSGLSVAQGSSVQASLLGEPVLKERTIQDLAIARRRWDTTLRNAEEFIRTHRDRRCSFTPIAACQGWDVASQVEMFQLQQEMGYQYIALGGLVRSQTTYILEVLDAVGALRKNTTKVHLFGVARPEAIEAFAQHGVASVDSARFLRQAWLSATSNYYVGAPSEYLSDVRKHGKSSDHQQDGRPWRYTALRIPPLLREGGDTPTAKGKALLSKGHSLSELQETETSVLALVHRFDRGETDLEETLTAVVEYDVMLGGSPKNEPHYRRLLQDKPWKSCPCKICQEVGIDVVIFRRNNRNRRRGFHNTWWFYQYFAEATSGRP